MAQVTGGRPLLPEEVRDEFKWILAERAGMTDEIAARGWADMPSRDVGYLGGKIGGNIVRALIRRAEEQLAARSAPLGPDRPE